MILVGDVLERLAELDAESVQCVVTSPPYFGLRSYLPKDHPDKAKEVGTERTPEEYTARLVEVFRGVRRVLRRDGCVWLNLGDSFAGGAGGRSDAGRQFHVNPSLGGGASTKHDGTRIRRDAPDLKPKDLIGIPWRVAFALQADGWYLRQAVTWCKMAPMPESVTDRPTSATEMVFLLTKSARYFYDSEAVAVPGGGKHSFWATAKHAAERQDGGRIDKTPATSRNIWNYWLLSPEPFPGAHYAVMPQKLVEPCILAGTSEAGCCRVCGAPWARVVERVGQVSSGPNKIATKPRSQNRSPGATPLSERPVDGYGDLPKWETRTTGWRPTCTHTGEPWPCQVLDPFLGSGTTAVVAERLGRRWVGIELDERSAAIARDRTAQLGFGRLLAAGGPTA